MTNLTVVLCTFNRSDSLRRTLESFASLDPPERINWEVLVVDNNSRDRTRDVVQEFCVRHPGRFRYTFEAQQGLSHARNTGIQQAKGTIIAFTDDDVLIEPNWLQSLSDALNDSQWAGAGGRILAEKGFAVPEWLSADTLSMGGVLPLFDLGENPGDLDRAPYGANMVYRKSMFDKYGLFRTDLGRCGDSMISSEDVEFGRRLLLAGERLRYQPTAIIYHPITEDRLRKQYFQTWWFGLGRSSVLLNGRGPDVWGIPRPCLSLAKQTVGLATNAVCWALALRPDRRFFFKLKVWNSAGSILEFYHQLLDSPTKTAFLPPKSNATSNLDMNSRDEARAPEPIHESAGARHSSSTPPDISVVIVTWNAKKFVDECLQSLHGTNSNDSMEIIVVDNASTDGTPELVNDRYPDVKLIQNCQNLGFAKANNIGIAIGTGKYLCLINSDVIVPEGCLKKMLRYIEQSPSIGMLGPKMLGPTGGARRSCMQFPTLWNSLCYSLALDLMFPRLSLFRSFLMRDFKHNETADVEVLNGWFWMIRKQAFDDVGVLDERFFIYGEDVDLCRRFHNGGWRVVFYSEAEAIHYGGASSSNAPLRFYLELQRARLQYWEKHCSRRSRRVFVIVLVIQEIARILGNAAQYPVRGSLRQSLALKIARSLSSIRWLVQIGLPSSGGWKPTQASPDN
jgi:hypothetical protein